MPNENSFLAKPLGQKFASDVVIYGLAQLMVALRGLVVLPIISKVLGATMYGIWSQMMITLALLSPILMLRLEIASVRYLAAREQRSASRDFFSMLGLIWLISLMALGITLLFRQQISLLIFANENLVTYVELLAVLLIVRANYNFLLNYYRTFNQILKYSLIQTIETTLEMGLIAFLVIYMRQGLTGALLALIVVELTAFLMMTTDIIRSAGFSISLDLMRLLPYLKYSLPLIPNAALYWIIDSSDRYVITHFLNLSSVGIYSASYSIARLIIFFSSPISFVLFPTISKLWGQGQYSRVRRYCEESVKYYLLFATPAVFGIYRFGPNILEFLATKEFTTNRVLILFIVLGMFFVGIYQIYLYIIHLKERTRYLPFIFLGVASFNLGLNFLLVPQWGILGAAFSTFLSYLLQFIAVLWLSVKLFPINFDFKFLLKSLLASVVMLLIISNFDPQNLAALAGVAFAGAAVYFAVLILIKGIGGREWHLFKSLFKRI